MLCCARERRKEMYVTHGLIAVAAAPAAQVALQRLERRALGVMAVNRPPDGLLGAGQGLAGTEMGLSGLGDCVAGGKNSVFGGRDGGAGGEATAGHLVVVVVAVVAVAVVVAVVVMLKKEKREDREDGAVRYL